MYPVVDIHCHIYPAAIAEKATQSIADFYRSQYEKYLYQPANVTGLPQVLMRERVGLSVIHSVATVPHQVQHINEFLARTVQESGGAFLAFGTLNPFRSPADLDEDIRHLLDLGLHGIKLHPDMQKFALDSPESFQLFDRCAGKLPILIHTGDRRFHYSNPAQLKPVLERYPEATIIGAHMGGYTCWEEATHELAGKYPNLYVDISSTMFAVAPNRVVELIRAYGKNRVLFGTDFPMWHPQEELKRFLALPLTESERQAILYQNACRLLGIRPTELKTAQPHPGISA